MCVCETSELIQVRLPAFDVDDSVHKHLGIVAGEQGPGKEKLYVVSKAKAGGYGIAVHVLHAAPINVSSGSGMILGVVWAGS